MHNTDLQAHRCIALQLQQASFVCMQIDFSICVALHTLLSHAPAWHVAQLRSDQLMTWRAAASRARPRLPKLPGYGCVHCALISTCESAMP